MQHEKFNLKNYDGLKKKIEQVGVTLPLSENIGLLSLPLNIGLKSVANRIAIQPMEGCDSTFDGRPDALTCRRYDRFARSGAGLIWFEAVAVVNEGRANPRQLSINSHTVNDYKTLVENVKETCMKANGFEPILIMQATHSGRYSKPNGTPQPVIAYNNPVFEKDNIIPRENIISDDRLAELEEKFGDAAHLAQYAGFDGIDIKCCHRYLCSELLSAYTREGCYGGSFENRTRLLHNGIISAQAATTKDFIVTSRLNIYDGFVYPYGFGVSEGKGLEPDLTEPLRLVNILHNQLELLLLNLTIGNPYINPHVNRPYDAGSYIPNEHPLEGVARMINCIGTIQKAYPKLNVISSGGSYLRQFSPYLAAGAVEQGYCKMAGFGRMAFAYPQFANDIQKTGRLIPSMCCIACGKCSELMRYGSTAGCVIRDKETYLPIYNHDVLGK